MKVKEPFRLKDQFFTEDGKPHVDSFGLVILAVVFLAIGVYHNLNPFG